jgi:thiol-disulfide isomerase/thioredoxin
MRKPIFCILLLLVTGTIVAQTATTTEPPYKRFPVVPPFNLLQVDSMTVFTKSDLKKKKPVLIMLFSPTCEHCQHETEELLQNIEAFKKVQIVMATTMDFSLMKEFYERYELAKYRNIRVGRDFQTTLPSFFMIHNLPYLAMYDKKGNLITTFEGAAKIEDVVNAFE